LLCYDGASLAVTLVSALKLPYGKRAIVDIAKLRDYCLSPARPEGRHKAKMFRASLGMQRGAADELRAALLIAAGEENAVPGNADEYGRHFVVDFPMQYAGRKAML